MTARVAWRQGDSRHTRRYRNAARYPYLLHWGNSRLTTPAKMRTYAGARVLATLWWLVGRRYLWIEERS